MTAAPPADRHPAVAPTPGGDGGRFAGAFLRVWRIGGGEFATAFVALVAVVLAQTSAPVLVVGILALALLVLMLLAEVIGLTTRPTGSFRLARVLILLAVQTRVVGADHLSTWVALALLAAVIVAEGIYSRLDGIAVPYAVNLPSVEVRSARLFPPAVIFYANGAAIFGVGLLTILVAPPVLIAAVVGAAVALTLVGLGDCLMRIRSRRQAEPRLHQVLTDFAPKFAVHWDAALGTGYQIGRWLPYLDRLGERYIVIVRNPRSFPEASTMTSQPILLRRGATTLDPVIVPSLSCVFYVNNALRNVHMVRYPGIRHIQLNHGDSDKAPSYNPVSRMFDKNFVAGQAAVDRFASHGVLTGADFFEIVGRPQVEQVQVAPGPISADAPRVLYAPTWAGMHTDSAYSSLPIGPAIVQGLLDRGCVIVYRPHPYANKSPALAAASAQIRTLIEADAKRSGRPHVWGPRAEKEWTIVDCFNNVDALVSDVSSVVPDFLYSEKPFAICAMSGTVEEFFEEMPVAHAGYVIAADAANLDQVFDDLLGTDPRLDVRTKLKTYYLGDFPADTYADAFLTAARHVIS